MKVEIDREGTPQGLAAHLSAWDGDAAVQGILVLACDENGFEPGQIDPCLQACTKPVFGGVFPQIIFGREHLTRGTLLVGLPAMPHLTLLETLSDPETDFEAQLEAVIRTSATDAPQTLFVFVDGFSSRIGALIDGLFNTFGLEINYIGGGCGSLSLKPAPCVISNKGLIQDAAVLAMLPMPSSVGVAHGWQPVSDAFKVTEVSGNVIHSLDWQPAFQVYREVVEAHAGRSFDQHDFFSIAKAYPFGIAKLGTEMVVRDPLLQQGDDLVCVGEVPRGAFVRILNGDRQSLVAAAARARGLAHDGLQQAPALQIFIDCVSRVLFMEQEFGHELAAVHDATLPMVGALTLGEIANSGVDYLEFYNKTAVVGYV